MIPILLIVFALILLLLLGSTSERPQCEHTFVPIGTRDYGTHRSVSYECEHCGLCTTGQL